MSSEELPALIFGPGLPAGGANGVLRVSSSGIQVEAGEHSQRTDVASLSLRAVGFAKRGLEIAWRDGTDSWAAHILDPDAAKRLLALPVLAGSAQGKRLQSDQRRAGARSGLGWAMLVAFQLLPVLLLLWALSTNTVTGWIAGRIPIEQEMHLGRQAFAVMRGSLKLENGGPAHDAVASIVTKLTQGSKYRYEVHVSNDEVVNAFAMPGGVIVVNRGLIAATKRPEELAGVLAHEVQHVELRHSVRRMVKGLGLRGLWALVGGDLSGTIAGQAALEFTERKFSRDDESEADATGFDALVRAGIDPSGMAAFFETMSEGRADAPVALLSTHPLSEDRKRELDRHVASLGPRDFTPLAFGPWPPPAPAAP